MFLFPWLPKPKKPTGQSGEDVATKFLKRHGLKILTRNFFNTKGRRLGEIDIIAKDHDTLVFVEVKTRVSSRADDRVVLPEEQITPEKLHKIHRVAQIYVAKNNLWHMPQRFDAVTIVRMDNQPDVIRHMQNIFF